MMLWKLWCESWARASEGWQVAFIVVCCIAGGTVGCIAVAWVAVTFGGWWAFALSLVIGVGIPVVGVLGSGRMKQRGGM